MSSVVTLCDYVVSMDADHNDDGLTFETMSARDFAHTANYIEYLASNGDDDLPMIAMFLVVTMNRNLKPIEVPYAVRDAMSERQRSALSNRLRYIYRIKPQFLELIQKQLEVYITAGMPSAVKCILQLSAYVLGTSYLVVKAALAPIPSPFKHEIIGVLITRGRIVIESGVLTLIYKKVSLDTFRMVLVEYMAQGHTITIAEYSALITHWISIKETMNKERCIHAESVLVSINEIVASRSNTKK